MDKLMNCRISVKPLYPIYGIILLLIFSASCKRNSTATTAFYYWKTGFQLNSRQAALLQQTALNRIYIRFFDVNWNKEQHRACPNAVVQFSQPLSGLHITPVIYIANKTFENSSDTAIDSLAIHCNTLMNRLAEEQSITYTQVQVDCDWSLTTRDKYFSFLSAFKKLNRHQLQATIRLHQVKYKARTGIPPVDRGVLMFYNMGKLNADLRQRNSIYNEADAGKYVSYLKAYPLQLDIALPLFSWSVQLRDNKVIQVYGKIGRPQLNNPADFETVAGENNYRAKRSFFLAGIYVKQNDVFKLEETTANSLDMAAKQLTENLPKQQNRTIIYYELANIDLSEFKAETIQQVSDRF
jgi:hypothetical protein